MSKKFYREIKVDGVFYHFNVGKHYVKIRGVEGDNNIPLKAFFKDYRSTNSSNGDDYKYAVSPGMIADYIQGKKIRDIMLKRPTLTCGCQKQSTAKHWRADPFDLEIHGEYNYRMWCDECYERRSWDI